MITTEFARTGAGSVTFSGATGSGSNLPSLLVSPITPVRSGSARHAEAYAGSPPPGSPRSR
ncbi:hypothetical protein MB27_27655 [Actinoplanes utahensis]|uniref:Uncharacterized protein n=1 Tax=Actinoplanes utahensis TaxID=1869 RepID=A0A0A6UEV3_ACTUT|nr:hypothetical protein MB27_27655 [Actinoplanes utahensis]